MQRVVFYIKTKVSVPTVVFVFPFARYNLGITNRIEFVVITNRILTFFHNRCFTSVMQRSTSDFQGRGMISRKEYHLFRSLDKSQNCFGERIENISAVVFISESNCHWFAICFYTEIGKRSFTDGICFVGISRYKYIAGSFAEFMALTDIFEILIYSS